MSEKELWVHTSHKAKVAEYDILKAAEEIIREKYNVRNVYLEKGRMYESAEYHTSHSWIETADRGKPTADQKAALEAIELLNKVRSGK